MSGAPLDVELTLRRGDQPLEGTWSLHQLDLRESLADLYAARLLVACEDICVPTEALLGARVELWAGTAASVLQLQGVILGARYERTFHGTAYYRLRVGPAISLLEHQARTRLFCDAAPLDLVAGLTDPVTLAFEGSMTAEYLEQPLEARDYTAQRGETDLDLLRRILADEGIYWTISHEGTSECVVLRDTASAFTDPEHLLHLPFVPGTNSYEPSIQRIQHGVSTHAESVHAGSWDWKGTPPKRFESSEQTHPSGHVFGHVELPPHERLRESDAGSGPHLDRTSIRARIGAERTISEATSVEGTSDALELRPGRGFELSGHPNPDLDRVFYATEVIHTFERAARDGSAAGFDYRNSFRALPEGVEFRPPRRVAPVAPGPETAVVVGDAKAPSSTDEHGRVRVRFAWAAEDESCPVRVSQAWAGSGYGAFFLPRPGMEVVVTYLDGHIERPLITGCVHNGANTPPLQLPDDRAQSTLKTQSYPDGQGSNELRFDDRKGREQVALRARRRLDMCVRGSHYATARGNREIVVGREDEGCLNTFVHGNTNTVVGGDTYTDVLGNEYTDVFWNSYFRTGGERTLSVEKTYTIDATSVRTQASERVQVKAAEVIHEGTQRVSIRGDVVAIEAQHELSLSVGGNHITIKPFTDGIYINGERTSINSGGARVEADILDDLPELETSSAIEALSASCRTRRGGGRGGKRPPRTNEPRYYKPHHPPPYPPPPTRKKKPKKEEPKPDDTCRFDGIRMECEHGRSTIGRVLEVVPRDGPDTIELAASTKGKCTDPPTWSVKGGAMLGTADKVHYDALQPNYDVKLFPFPRDVRDRLKPTIIIAELPGGPSEFREILVFPTNTIDVDAELPVERITKEFIDPLFREMPFVEDLLGMLPVSVKLEVARMLWQVSFEEYTDYRAYLRYSLEFHVKGEVKVDVALKVSKAIKIVNRLIKASKFKYADEFISVLKRFNFEPKVYFQNKPDIDVEWHRRGPDDDLFVQPEKGSDLNFDISIGLAFDASLPSPVGNKKALKIGFDASFNYNFSGLPTFSSSALKVRARWTVTDIVLKDAYLDTPIGKLSLKDALDEPDEGLKLLSRLVDPSKLSFGFEVDLTWLLEMAE
ncbi:MAG: type VI secretion system tip protein TssI/VgrG [Myxococcota bacterium]